MNGNRKLVVGQIGVGNFGAARRARMRAAGCFDLVAVSDRNPEALAAAAQAENARAYDAAPALLAHPGLEAVVISTGADSHATLAVAALRAGLHVFVEKPLCCSEEEVQTLVRVQRETGRVVGVGHDHCASDPLLRLARRFMEEGRLGVVAAVEENSSHSGGLLIRPGDWRGLAAHNPGGMLFQCGVHSLHALAHLFGPVASVQAMMRHDAHPATETADAANVLLRFRSGLIGTLNCYHVTAYCHELRLFGTRGNLYLDTHRKQAWFQECRVGGVEEREPVPVPSAPPEHAYAGMCSWYEGIRAGTPVVPGLSEGIAAVRPVFAAERSARERREVALAERD